MRVLAHGPEGKAGGDAAGNDECVAGWHAIGDLPQAVSTSYRGGAPSIFRSIVLQRWSGNEVQ